MTAATSLWKSVTGKLNALPGADFQLAARVAVAFPFWVSGRGKVNADEGFFTLSEWAVYPFEEEYSVPFFDPATAATLAMYAETLIPVFLVLGLFTRAASVALLGLIAVITVSYPAGFKLFEFAAWVLPAVALLLRGPGAISLDNLLGRISGYSRD